MYPLKCISNFRLNKVQKAVWYSYVFFFWKIVNFILSYIFIELSRTRLRIYIYIDFLSVYVMIKKWILRKIYNIKLFLYTDNFADSLLAYLKRNEPGIILNMEKYVEYVPITLKIF